MKCKKCGIELSEGHIEVDYYHLSIDGDKVFSGREHICEPCFMIYHQKVMGEYRDRMLQKPTQEETLNDVLRDGVERLERLNSKLNG